MLQGRTPLHHAASASAYKIAKLLLLYGSKPTIEDSQVRAFAHVCAVDAALKKVCCLCHRILHHSQYAATTSSKNAILAMLQACSSLP